MKLTPLLEQRNNKPFMLQVQQRLIDDWDIEAELTFEDERFELNYEYDPFNDERFIHVSLLCRADDNMVRIIVNSDTFSDGAIADAAGLNIKQVMTTITSLTSRAEATLSD